ncbi:hypothetical protein ACFXTI_027869 [Malus domestica]
MSTHISKYGSKMSLSRAMHGHENQKHVQFRRIGEPEEIRPWTHMMEVPQLHGFGPAANRLLEAYKMLLKFLGNLRNLRDSYAALAVGSSDSVAGEPSSVTRIISECESALTFLNRDLGILSASIAREQGEEVSL